MATHLSCVLVVPQSSHGYKQRLTFGHMHHLCIHRPQFLDQDRTDTIVRHTAVSEAVTLICSYMDYDKYKNANEIQKRFANEGDKRSKPALDYIPEDLFLHHTSTPGNIQASPLNIKHKCAPMQNSPKLNET